MRMSSKSTSTSAGFPRPLWFLLAAVTLVVAAIAARVGIACRQFAAIQAIERVAGAPSVWSGPVRWKPVKMAPGGPRWLRERLGDERMKLFDTATSATFLSSRAHDGDLVHLRWLPDLERLDLNGRQLPDETDEAGLASLKGAFFLTTEREPVSIARLAWLSDRPEVTDAGLVHISQLTNLRRLNLTDIQITNAGLNHLRHLTKLEELDLEGTLVTDAGLAALAPLADLETLGLSGSRITDAGMPQLGKLSKLRYLRLLDTKVTGSGFVHLQGLADLRVIVLHGSPITDEGLRHLAAIPSLTHIYVSDSEITDAGLASLEKLPKLQRLDVRGTRVTEAATAPLREILVKNPPDADGESP